jgi:hypothetical protein
MAEADSPKKSFIDEMRKRGYAVERAGGINFGLIHVTYEDGISVVDEIDAQDPDVLVLEYAGYTRRIARRIENFIYRNIPENDPRYSELLANPYIKGVLVGLRNRHIAGKPVPAVALADMPSGNAYREYTQVFSKYVNASFAAVQEKLSFEDAKLSLLQHTRTFVSANADRERGIIERLPDAFLMARRSQHLRDKKEMKVMFAYGAEHSQLTTLASEAGIHTAQHWQHPEMPRDHSGQLTGWVRHNQPMPADLVEKALLSPLILPLLSKVPGLSELKFNSNDHLKRFVQVIIDTLTVEQRKQVYEAILRDEGPQVLMQALAGKHLNVPPPLRRGQKPPFQIVVHMPPPGTVIQLTEKKKPGDSGNR